MRVAVATASAPANAITITIIIMKTQAMFEAESLRTGGASYFPGAVRNHRPAAETRPRVEGKFLFVGEEKLWVKGVTYGSFRPDENSSQFPPRHQVEQDFVQMAASGINAVRTYTVPPRWLLDLALQSGLRVMVGIPWEQHIAFLDDKTRIRSIEKQVRAAGRSCAGHPALLCYAVGNEIPASIVRWHGRRRIERFIKRLYQLVKNEDPDSLVTYVNYPTTEFLQLSFLDFLCFNVYLESRQRLEAYLARLQNMTDERPLLMAEIGLDSRRHGENEQAHSLAWQLRSVFSSGCVGAFVFAWTDEWYRGGHDIEDWDFGLTTRDRRPKSALSAVARVFADSPFSLDTKWPGISIVVCSYNGAKTIRDTLEGLKKLHYPDYEVIVVDDGSTDDTPVIAEEYGTRLISTENRGLSSARNTGYQAARKEIVAYIDDDAYPDEDWAHYLALTYLSTEYVGVGGPNLAPAGDGSIADCVANAPGGPVHVLLSDTLAEHIPGCNMSYRRSALVTVGGCDPRYRAAGDDVDLCWRIQEQVGQIGFHPAAMVWHHRRNSMQMYWKQQQGYGKAEALLEEKWPAKYNPLGHTSWRGRLYGKGLTLDLGALRGRIYQGTWGSAPFQLLYQPAPGTLLSLPLMPEWYLLIGLLAILSLLSLGWPPLGIVVPLFLAALALPLAQALFSAARAKFTSAPQTLEHRAELFTITAFMHLQQPLARLIGRLRHGLTPWRRRGVVRWVPPVPKDLSIWHEQWEAPDRTLDELRQRLSESGGVVTAGGDYDAWDLEVRGGMLGGARVLMATEEHGAGKQLLRFRVWPRWSVFGIVPGVIFAAISLGSFTDGALLVGALSALGTALVVACAIADSGYATGSVSNALEQLDGS
jgi:GT2 family glycosyltransferase